jgi:hypothetical protein
VPLDTNWISWAILIIVLVWLGITQRMWLQIQRNRQNEPTPVPELEPARFPDQCPCATEVGEGIQEGDPLGG